MRMRAAGLRQVCGGRGNTVGSSALSQGAGEGQVPSLLGGIHRGQSSSLYTTYLQSSHWRAQDFFCFEGRRTK